MMDVSVVHAAAPAPAATLSSLGPAQAPVPLQVDAGSDAYVPQYSPQIYSVVGFGIGDVLQANVYNPNIAFPPLPGQAPNLIPSLPELATLPFSTTGAATQRMNAAAHATQSRVALSSHPAR